MNNAAIILRDAGNGETFDASRISCVSGGRKGIKSTLPVALQRYSGGKSITGGFHGRGFGMKTFRYISIPALIPQT